MLDFSVVDTVDDYSEVSEEGVEEPAEDLAESLIDLVEALPRFYNDQEFFIEVLGEFIERMEGEFKI